LLVAIEEEISSKLMSIPIFEQNPGTILIIGSSVAFGLYASPGKGWAALLAVALKKRSGWRIQNIANPGDDTKLTIERFRQKGVTLQPDVVIIGLSLLNEGILWGRKEDVCDSFRKGMQILIQMIKDCGAIPILGGLYPCNEYSWFEYETLKDMQNEMEHSWGIPVFNFMRAVDDGKGHWKNDIYVDSGHPNDTGHKLMFEAIDLSLFDPLVIEVKQKYLRAKH